MEKIIKEDRTFVRRFIGPQEYDGSKLNFTGFNIDETFEMYRAYKEKWLKRYFDKGEIKAGLYHELRESEWPISKDAISLIWEATNNTPGILQKLFQRALNDLEKKYPDNWLNPNNNITPKSIASAIEIFISRGESGMKLLDKNLKNKISVLKEPDRYFGVMTKHSLDDVFIQVAVDLIKKKGFIVGEKFKTEQNGCYIQELSKPDNGVIKKFALGFLISHGKSIAEEDIKFLNKLISKRQGGYEVTYILIVTSYGYKYIYDPWNRKPIHIFGPFGHHLGNYTYTIPLDSEKIQYLMATYTQRNEEYYPILLELIDKNFRKDIEIALSDILVSFCNAALYYKG